MKVVFIYVTFPNKEEAALIGEQLLKKRLAACVNTFGEFGSQYWWDGKIESGKEVAVIIKTMENRQAQVMEEIKNHHSYKNPCLISFKADQVASSYQRWLEESIM